MRSLYGKNKNIILRISEYDHKLITYKSKLFNISNSKLLRDGAFLICENNNISLKKIQYEYSKSNEEEKKIIVDLLFNYYRRKGYPNYDFSEEEIHNEMKRISNSKHPLLEDNNLQINTTGIKLANYFHPHMAKVKYKNYNSPSEQYRNDDKLIDSIKKWLDLGKQPTLSGIRTILKTRNGVRSVVNFKPSIAKYIYDNYCLFGGKTLDPCAGFGGRLCGCIASNKNVFYHGIDPDGETAIGNTKIASCFKETWNFKFRFDIGCAEEVMKNLNCNDYDLIFTSPPYFDLEMYSNSSHQSCIKFSTYEKWKELFLSVIIKESKRILKENGYFVLNVKNTKKRKIADDVLKIAEEYGFYLEKIYKMRLANSEFNRTNKNSCDDSKTWHTEPIFVFKN